MHRTKALIIVLSLICISPSVKAIEALSVSHITDMPINHWAESYANYLTERGIMDVTDEGEFLPEQQVNRAEMVDTIIRQIGIELPPPSVATFSDVPLDHPYFAPIEAAFDLGIIRGFPQEDGSQIFRPSAPVTRAQFVKIILEANNINRPLGVSSSEFPDIDPAGWEAPYVFTARKLGFINGYNNGSFGPHDNVTRAQLAKIIYLFLEKTGQVPVIYSSSDITNTENYEALALSMVNASRSEAGKPPLIVDSSLSQIARDHARWLADNDIGSLSHTGQDDTSPFDRLNRANIRYAAAAENIGMSTANNQNISAAVTSIHSDPHSGMMNEINHRHNILGTLYDFDQIGIGVVVADHNNSRQVLLVELFIESQE